jgi:hypothetical protein
LAEMNTTKMWVQDFQKPCFSSFVEGLAEMKASSEKCKTESWRRKRDRHWLTPMPEEIAVLGYLKQYSQILPHVVHQIFSVLKFELELDFSKTKTSWLIQMVSNEGPYIGIQLCNQILE